MTAPATAYVSIGSNMGDREGFLRGAVNGFRRHEHLDLLGCSNLYETEPVGYTVQPYFLNMAVAIETAMEPHDLLRVLQNIERAAGRTRDIRWGPRTLDLDLLWMARCDISDLELELPHPRMTARAFVLIPLLDVLQDGVGLTQEFIARALANLDGREEVKLWKRINWLNESAPFES